MAFSALPTALIASWSEDGTNVTFPIASVPQLTAAEADAATGDNRKIVYALMERFYQWYLALAVADRPTRLEVTRQSGALDSSGNIVISYKVNITVTTTGIEVLAE